MKLQFDTVVLGSDGLEDSTRKSGDGWMRRSNKKLQACNCVSASAGATVSSHVVYSAKMVSTAASHSIGPPPRKPRPTAVPPLSRLLGPARHVWGTLSVLDDKR